MPFYFTICIFNFFICRERDKLKKQSISQLYIFQIFIFKSLFCTHLFIMPSLSYFKSPYIFNNAVTFLYTFKMRIIHNLKILCNSYILQLTVLLLNFNLFLIGKQLEVLIKNLLPHFQQLHLGLVTLNRPPFKDKYSILLVLIGKLSCSYKLELFLSLADFNCVWHFLFCLYD